MKFTFKIIFGSFVFTLLEAFLLDSLDKFFILFIANTLVFSWMFNGRRRIRKEYIKNDEDRDDRPDSFSPSEERAYLAAERIKDIKRNL